MPASPGRSSSSSPLASERSRRGTDPTTRLPSASAPSRSGASSAGRVSSPPASSSSARTPSRTGSAAPILCQDRRLDREARPSRPALRRRRACHDRSHRPLRLRRRGRDRPHPRLRRLEGLRALRSQDRWRERLDPLRRRPVPPRAPRPVIARFVHHVWMMDVTEVRSFLGLRVFHVAGVFDAFSRVPLALQVSETKPGAARMARLLAATARAFGAPKYLITDLGGEFRGRVFAQSGPAARHPAALRLRPRTSTPPPASNASGEPSRTPRAFASTVPSPSRTWSEGSRSRSHTTSCSAHTRGSTARHLRRPSSASAPPAQRPFRLRGGAPARDPETRPSQSTTSTLRTGAFRSSRTPPDDRRAVRPPSRRLTATGAALLSPSRASGLPHPSRAISPLAHPVRSPLPPVQARLQLPLPAYPRSDLARPKTAALTALDGRERKRSAGESQERTRSDQIPTRRTGRRDQIRAIPGKK